MDVSVEIHCDRCGSANFSLPDGAAEEGLLLCNDCGETLGTFAQLKAELASCAVEHSSEALRSGLERLPTLDRSSG